MFSPIEALNSKGFWLTTAINLGVGSEENQEPNIPMVGRQVQLFQVEVVNEDSSLARVVDSQEKMGEGAFSCSRVTNHCCHSTRAELDAELPDHLKQRKIITCST